MKNVDQPTDFHEAIREIWEANKARVDDDLLLISRVVRALCDLQQAREAAHRLAGSLGIFGMNEAEHSARCIEDLLVAAIGALGDEPAKVLFLVEKLEKEISTFEALP